MRIFQDWYGEGAITLEIKLLGRFVLQSQAGLELGNPSRKGQALMAVLALAGGHGVARERLATLLWSDRGDQQARSSLRQALTELRKALPDLDPPLLVADRGGVCIDPDAIEVDALTFEHLIEEGTPGALAAAVELYRGDFLEDIGVHDPVFEEWLREKRQSLRGRAIDALLRLLDHQMDHDAERAMTTAQRLLALDPLLEAAHRAVMRLLADKGERTLALKQFDICRGFLAAELGVPPEPETEKLAQEVRGPAQHRSEPAVPAIGPLVPEADSLQLPDEPAIAVLPFDNISGDPEQEYFADGITENIITALSRIPGLLVVARHSTMIYKGQSLDVKRIGREQGVRYVMEGSVRKSGKRIRVTALLIDAATGGHQWAERYDRELDDLFEVQDEITKKVTTELHVRLARGEEVRVWSGGTSNIEAWENITRAWALSDRHVRENNIEARRLADEAIRLDPAFAAAWVICGWTHWEDALWGWSESKESSMEGALCCARRALECDSENPEALVLLATIHLTNKDARKAIELGKQAIALSPSHASNIALVAMAMILGGEPTNGLHLMLRAMRLSPNYPQWYVMMVGVVHYIFGDHDKAIEIFRQCVAKEPETVLHRIWLASSLIEAGQDGEAKRLAEEILAIEPDFTASSWVDGFGTDESLTASLLANLAKAGLPK